MGPFDFPVGRRRSDPGRAQAEVTVMRDEKPSWVLVEGSSPEAIQEAVIKHAAITRPVQPSRYSVSIIQIDATRYGVTFSPAIPPYAFTNLIGWLDDPRMTRGARRAVGWLVAPGSGRRYFLAPQRANAGGGTLVGVGDDGERVSVYLPDGGVKRTAERLPAVPEPEWPAQGTGAVAAFEVTVDSDGSFGNPQFAIG